MAKFILAFRKLLNLISFSAPSDDQISKLSDDETIAYISEETDGTLTLTAVENDGETIKLAKGTVVSNR